MADLRQLFGGALVAGVPTRFDDVSDFRQVPDNQEVFSDPARDQSVIIELLQYEPTISDDQIAQYHFKEIASANDCPVSEVVTVQPLTPQEAPHFADPAVTKIVLHGRQQVAKFNESAANIVNLYLAVIRMPAIQTDLLVTFNEPAALNPASSSSRHIDPNSANQSFAGESLQLFQNLIRTLEVRDTSIFATN
eukprot:TRINITY_DN2102_c0_g1_i1.p1 TRINITY_DN2102_c0_g1~~TRINITY_DN2102_c0_g1_i1.p1  ORF type:complete len:193 (-),score=62.05 TRINITY_DN2102_c0_g1_i1:164-742(-)